VRPIPRITKSRKCGIHWVAYNKSKNNFSFDDSFGNQQPPREVVKYLVQDRIQYNYSRVNRFDTYNCEHLLFLLSIVDDVESYPVCFGGSFIFGGLKINVYESVISLWNR